MLSSDGLSKKKCSHQTMVELLAQRAIRVKSGRTERCRNIMRALVLHHHGTVTARCAQRQYVELLARTAHGEAGFRTRMAFDLTGREEAPGVQGEGRGRDSSHTGDRRRGRSLMRRPAVGVVYGQALCTPEPRRGARMASPGNGPRLGALGKVRAFAFPPCERTKVLNLPL